MNNLISISGKLGSGKDEVGRIIQYLNSTKNPNTQEYILKYFKPNINVEGSVFTIKKFADKLKDMVCLMLGCTKEQLEDQKFKETELGEEWWQYGLINKNARKPILYPSKKGDIEKELKVFNNAKMYINKLTPRKLLQLLGTECGRQIIHPNIWVNALMSEYKLTSKVVKTRTRRLTALQSLHANQEAKANIKFPNWIITDMRFLNEAQAIKDKGGITIRVNRYCYDSLEDYLVTHPNKKVSEKAVKIVSDWGFNKHGVMEEKLKEIPESKDYYNKSNHLSETALDDYKGFDYILENDGTIEDLFNKVENILL
jgi:hypothetical protein